MTSDAERGMTHTSTVHEHPTVSKIKLDLLVFFFVLPND